MAGDEANPLTASGSSSKNDMAKVAMRPNGDVVSRGEVQLLVFPRRESKADSEWNTPRKWYNLRLTDALVQIIIVGLLALSCPGLFNALTGLGGAGNENPNFANAANACLYGSFALFGYFGSVAFNLLGNRVLMSVGGVCYAIYAATQYAAGNVASLGWLAPVGGLILGFGAGWFWTAQGAMMLAYSTPDTRGKYVAIFWVIFNLGGMIGGLISFAVNFHSQTIGNANTATYFTFIVIMLLGAFSSLVLLVNPSRVVREDGERVCFSAGISMFAEIRSVLSLTLLRRLLLLLPLFLTSNWFYTYHFNGVNGLLFTIRTRGLNSALYWGAQMVGAIFLSRAFLDRRKLSEKQRAVVTLGFVICFVSLSYGMGAYLQMGFEGSGYDKDHHPVRIDFTDPSRAWFPILVFVFYGFCDAIVQTFAYWIMGVLADGDTQLCSRYAGVYKGIQSAGAAVAWGLDLSSSVTYTIQFWICWLLLGTSLVSAFVCVWLISPSKPAKEDFHNVESINDTSVTPCPLRHSPSKAVL